MSMEAQQSYIALGPRPLLDERPIYEPRYEVEGFIVPLLKREISLLLDEYCSPGSGLAVLDVGCGRQPFRKLLESRGHHYVGMDTQAAADGSVQIVGAIDSALPVQGLPVEAFDVVLCTEVLEHVADWHAAYQNIAYALKPGGHVLMTCPHFYIPHEEPYDFWRPTPNAIRFNAESANLRVVTIRKCGTGWDLLGTLLAASQITPANPNKMGRLITKFTERSRLWLLRQLRSGAVQRHMSFQSMFYLSVIGVLEKPQPISEIPALHPVDQNAIS